MNYDPRTVSLMNMDHLEQSTRHFRKIFELEPGKVVRMVHMLEHVLPEVLPGFDFLVLPDEEMPGVDGLTSSGGKLTIWLSDSTYSKLCNGDPHAQWVAAHELGHLFLHSYQEPGFAKKHQYDERLDPEWQADRFADMWLMPADGVKKCRSARHVAAKFNVPDDVAERRFKEVMFGEPIQGELF